MRFGGTPASSVEEHARRLAAAPGDPSVHPYPPQLVPPADASVVLGRGHRPVVVLFYDPASRASDLQASEFLPVLSRLSGRVDVVPIDVKASARWTADERQVVRKYYMAVVPSTVVLTADRSPELLKFQRISAAELETSLERALAR
jgi:hypothetical protein